MSRLKNGDYSYEVFLNWTRPARGDCQARGKRLKESDVRQEPQIECVDQPPKGKLMYTFLYVYVFNSVDGTFNVQKTESLVIEKTNFMILIISRS